MVRFYQKVGIELCWSKNNADGIFFERGERTAGCIQQLRQITAQNRAGLTETKHNIIYKIAC
ncbi:hypothetical protein D3C71_1433950 [compost metagenome]